MASGDEMSEGLPATYNAEDLEVVELSPFDIHFSQARIRCMFQDGRNLDDSTDEIEIIEREPVKLDGAEEPTEVVFLKTPFPTIEVIKWRCKLREADGAPKVDPSSGLELYSEEELWFTFDNRRLCCLQRKAASVWPKRALCEVALVPLSEAGTRKLRKFDTRTGGHSVSIGTRDEPILDTWCWRTQVGLPPAQQPEGGVPKQQRLRWRGPRQGPSTRSSSRGRRGNEVEEGRGSDFARSLSLFLLVYLALRFTMWLIRKEQFSFVGRFMGSIMPARGAAVNTTA